MCEKILAYKHKVHKPSVRVIDLAAVAIYPSRLLWRAQLIIYVAMLAFSLIALAPFFLTHAVVDILWLMFVLALIFPAAKSYSVKKSSPISFEIKQNCWRLDQGGRVRQRGLAVTLAGEVLLWSWLIIVPLRENLTGKRCCLLALPDSMSASDWRRLSVWMRTCLYEFN